jgi:hypothetical protein
MSTNPLHLRGDQENPRRISASELHELPRAEVWTTDPLNSGKDVVYSGTPFVEVLKAGGLPLGSGMTGIREIVTMTVFIEAADGHRAVFSLAELCPDFFDRVTLLADTKDKQPLPPGEGPFRIIAPSEKLRGRWVSQVKAVAVHCPDRRLRLRLLVDQE